MLKQVMGELKIYSLPDKKDFDSLFDHLTVGRAGNKKPMVTAKVDSVIKEDESKLYNVTDHECSKCFKKQSREVKIQMRGLDEPESIVAICICQHKWLLYD